jgi:hypothetical protein
VSIDTVYACRMSVLIAAGSWASRAGLLSAADGFTPAGSRAPCSAVASSLASRLENTAPKTDTPNDPPIVRKKVTPEVAAPRSA